MSDQTRVLIVEDDCLLREELAAGLAASGFAVSVAADGKAGARLATEDGPDLILLDVETPGVDGLRLAQVVRALVPAAGLVMMSGHAYLRTAARDLLGDIEILAKPFALDDLLARFAQKRSQSAAETPISRGMSSPA
ncbi:response regulator transcription factor [Zavarzinia sp.]|uniref:response regulator transcription factor n=1 Tax=Zavarzinia sp. TaxID=2027920 RepID=UPI003565CE32